MHPLTITNQPQTPSKTSKTLANVHKSVSSTANVKENKNTT